MLTKCPECALQVSDKAVVCPHCGYPLQKDIVNQSYRKSKKRRRLPNGFGQITEIKGQKLREPFRARVTVGKDENGYPICKLLKPKAYFSTYNEAYAALVEYNKNPYDLNDDITVKELYDRWSKEYFVNIKDNSKRTVSAAWAYCSSIGNMRVKDVRGRHIKGCMEDGTIEYRGEIRHASANMKSRIKSLFNLMLDYALEYELVDKNYARTFDISDEIIEEAETSRREHMSFKDSEMELLWDNLYKIPYVEVVLFQCYSGWRPQELGLLRLENINLEAGTMMGGMKTESGTNRIVPIHPRIRSIVERMYSEAVELGSEYLINCTDTSTHRSSLMFTYDKYNKRFIKIRDQLKLDPNHRPHDPKKHFTTMCKKYNVDEYAIKYMVGHKIEDLTERVYTDREISWLCEEIKKIK